MLVLKKNSQLIFCWFCSEPTCNTQKLLKKLTPTYAKNPSMCWITTELPNPLLVVPEILNCCLIQAMTPSNSDFGFLNCIIISELIFQVEEENGFLPISVGRDTENHSMTKQMSCCYQTPINLGRRTQISQQAKKKKATKQNNQKASKQTNKTNSGACE